MTCGFEEHEARQHTNSRKPTKKRSAWWRTATPLLEWEPIFGGKRRGKGRIGEPPPETGGRQCNSDDSVQVVASHPPSGHLTEETQVAVRMNRDEPHPTSWFNWRPRLRRGPTGRPAIRVVCAGASDSCRLCRGRRFASFVPGPAIRVVCAGASDSRLCWGQRFAFVPTVICGPCRRMPLTVSRRYPCGDTGEAISFPRSVAKSSRMSLLWNSRPS